MMHLARFGTRLAVALVVIALVVLAHARHHLQLLQILAGAVLIVWVVIEARRGIRRHHPSKPVGSPRP